MSIETTLLIGVLTIGAIAFGADCLWNLVIRSSLLNTSNLTEEADANRFLEMTANAQRQTNQFLVVVLLIVLVGAIALNVIPNSHLEPYLIRIGLLSLTVVLSLILVEFARMYRIIAIKPIITNIFIGIRLIAQLVAYWSFVHYALNPKI